MGAFLHIFCFVNHKEGATRVRITIMYTVFLLENSLFAGLWLGYVSTSYVGMGVLQWLLVVSVWGCFVLGVICMLFYYRYFHPNIKFSQGWFDIRSHAIVLEDCLEEEEEEEEKEKNGDGGGV